MYAINTNIRSQFSTAALSMIERKQNVAMQQLSTGKRINSAKDDAAGMAIAARMSDLIRGTNQAIKNANDGINLIQTAEGASQQVMDILQRMRELAVQSATSTYSSDQRTHMDAEYQELKSTIVQIANKTQWNGMTLLNGTAGTQASLPALYKSISKPSFSTNYQGQTHVPSLLQGVISATQLSKNPTEGFYVYGDLSIKLTNGSLTKAELETDNGNYDLSTAGSVALSAGIYSIHFSAEKLRDAGLGFLADQNITLTTAYKDADLTLTQSAPILVKANDAFTKIGRLSIKTAYNSITNTTTVANANYTLGDGTAIDIDPSFFLIQTDKITLSRSLAASNAQLMNALFTDLVLTGTGIPKSMTLSMEIGQANKAKTIENGDLIINDIRITPDGIDYDALSPAGNSKASAISKAGLINAYKDQTGVTAVVNTNTMAGTAMKLSARSIEGSIAINGYRTRLIKTSTELTDITRSDITAAINEITRLTGVKAIDSLSDAKGIVLQTADGRNIEVGFLTNESDATFSQAIGLRDGVQIGTYSLAAHDKKGLKISSDSDANAENSGLSEVQYSSERLTSVQVNSGLLVNSSNDVAALQTGDLVLNGVEIPASSALSDTVSNLNVETSSRYASAIAIAAAINSKTKETKVTATVKPVVISGNAITTDVSGSANLYINAKLVNIAIDSDDSDSHRRELVKQAIEDANVTEIEVSNNGDGIRLTALDGRNISIWSSVPPSELGLSFKDKYDKSTIPDGVSTSADAPSYSKGATMYASLVLQSTQNISIQPGINGYGEKSNFSALGFTEQEYQTNSQVKGKYYDPAQVARLTFQIGGQKDQSMDIYLPDFGSNGVLTHAITWDEDMSDSERSALLTSPLTESTSDYGLTQPPPVSSLKEVVSAKVALTALDDVIKNINQAQATFGAFINRLEKTVANLSTYYVNMSASRSSVEDTDYAAASSEMAKAQIMQQAATAILAQANTNQQIVLKLLQS